MKNKTKTFHILSDKKTITKLRRALEHIRGLTPMVQIAGSSLSEIRKIAERALKATDMNLAPKAKSKEKK